MYLEGEEVTLQAVSYEDGLSAEHVEDHSLHVSQGDGRILQVLLCYTRKPAQTMMKTYFLFVLACVRAYARYCTSPHSRLKKVSLDPLPCVVVNHFAFGFDKRVIDDFQLRVDNSHPGQLQTLLCVALLPRRERKREDTLYRVLRATLSTQTANCARRKAAQQPAHHLTVQGIDSTVAVRGQLFLKGLNVATQRLFASVLNVLL